MRCNRKIARLAVTPHKKIERLSSITKIWQLRCRKDSIKNFEFSLLKN